MKGILATVLALGLAFAALPAHASGGGGDHGGGHGEANADAKGTPGNNVELPVLMAPVSDTGGKLVAYAYISAKIEATSVTAALAIREKLAFIQDAFLREVNRLQVADPAHTDHVDEHKLQVRMHATAQKTLGGKQIKNLTITKVQIASLYPKAVPQTPEAGLEMLLASEPQKKPEKKASSGGHH